MAEHTPTTASQPIPSTGAVPNPAQAAGRLDTAGWQDALDRLADLEPAASLAAAEDLLADLEQGLGSL